jgi:hypothetical protein
MIPMQAAAGLTLAALAAVAAARRTEAEDCAAGASCSPPAVAISSYGAIAYGRLSRAWGYSERWSDQARAESVALQNCAQTGDDCRVMVWFDRSCGAVAADGGRAAFWGVGSDADAAGRQALEHCQDAGGMVCEIKAARCSR